MSTYEAYAPNEIEVKVITAEYDEDLEMKITEFLHNRIDEDATILNIHYTDNMNDRGTRYLSAIITYAIERL